MYIDLSVPITEKTPVYPGDPATLVEAAGDLGADGYCDHYVSIGTHVGTHVDAPMHMLEGGKSLNQYPLESFIGRGRYIQVNDKKFSLEAVKQAKVQPGDIVLFDTGMSTQYYDEVYFETYPALPADIAHYLVEQKVKMVGVDMASVDHDPFDIHKLLLGADVLIIENLINLGQLSGRDFTIYALPLNLQVDDSPARVIAQLAN